MNAQQTNSSPHIVKESKNKIKVDFDRTPLKDRLKARFVNMYFLEKVIWYVFRLVLLLGISYVILFPFFSKITGSFMSEKDFLDVTVKLIPKYPTFDTYKAIFTENHYLQAFGNTLLLSLGCALLQTAVCCLVGYGIAKFKFRGSKIVFFAVILSMVIPHGTLELSMFMEFRYFDLLGIFKLLGGGVFDWLNIIGKEYIDLNNSFWPLMILSVTGLAFKNGLYIFMMRQFFRGVPDELEESAYVDGSGTFRTFLQIIIPLSVPMMITVFLFAFSWQWTDNFYTTVFFTSSKVVLMPDIVQIPASLVTNSAATNLYNSAIYSTCGLMIILPLIIMYLFCQRYLIQGIERSGIVG